jgi:hypothetical protein
MLVHPLEPTQVEEELLVGRLDDWTDPLKLVEDHAEHRGRVDRIWLTDDGIWRQGCDFAQWQARSNAITLGLRRAILHDLALALTAAKHNRAAVPVRMTEHLDPDQEAREPDTGDAAYWPGDRLCDSRLTTSQSNPLTTTSPFNSRT